MIQIRLSERQSQIKSDRGNILMIQIRLSVSQRLIFSFNKTVCSAFMAKGCTFGELLNVKVCKVSMKV